MSHLVRAVASVGAVGAFAPSVFENLIFASLRLHFLDSNKWLTGKNILHPRFQIRKGGPVVVSQEGSNT